MTSSFEANARDRLIVALDTPNRSDAENLVAKIGGTASFYKIGLGMLASGGLGLAADLKAQGFRVFLDMKLFDIAATVESATRGLAAMGVDFLTVHADPHVVRAAHAGRGDGATKILAVTVLTSLDRADLDAAMIVEGAIADLVVERARRAFLSGADGVIASPLEVAAIRALPEATGKLIVTPGVRPADSATDDQKRIATPAQAIAAGADHIVVGRPIHRAPDPAAAARAILSSLA